MSVFARLAMCSLLALAASCDQEVDRDAQRHPMREDRGFDYCRLSGRSALVLLDRTTTFDDARRSSVTGSLQSIVDGLGPGDRLIVGTIEAHYSQSAVVFDSCTPGCVAQSNPIAELLSDCRALVAQADARVFRNRLATAVRPLIFESMESPQSDIARTIAESSKITRNPVTDLYVFSDMLENSDALPPAQLREEEPSVSVARLRDLGIGPSLRNTHVRIVGLGSPHSATSASLSPAEELHLRQFWTLYFQEGGATDVRFAPRISD